MHRNFYLFERQAKQLSPVLEGAEIIRCFTHRKDELVIVLKKEEEYFLRIGIARHLPYFLLYSSQNIRDASTSFFPEINDQKITAISAKPFDKIVELGITGDFRIEMVFYGKQPNIWLFSQDIIPVAGFKSGSYQKAQQKHDLILHPCCGEPAVFSNWLYDSGERSIIDFLCHHVGGFNTLMARELCDRCQIDGAQTAKGLSEPDVDCLLRHLRQLYTEISTGPALIQQDPIAGLRFLLYQPSERPAAETDKIYENLNEGWKFYIRESGYVTDVHKLKAKLHSAVANKIAYLRQTLSKIAGDEELQARKEESELKGNLLLTNISRLPAGQDIVKVTNIFSDQQEEITIQLNPNKSIQENAQRYFNKYKDLYVKKDRLKIKKTTISAELEIWTSRGQELEKAKELKRLRKMETILVNAGVLQKQENKQAAADDHGLSFNRILLGQKWEVLIGKNAANNDLLTFKYARKFDLWFHARGVPGSHVVLRLPGRDQLPSREILESVASVAAWFSDARNSSVVPVAVTEVRYVRKPRKSGPGMVTYTNEKVLMVEPKKYL